VNDNRWLPWTLLTGAGWALRGLSGFRFFVITHACLNTTMRKCFQGPHALNCGAIRVSWCCNFPQLLCPTRDASQRSFHCRDSVAKSMR
jgi:hypothetical protein